MLVTSMLDIGERMTRDTDVTMLNKTLDVDSALSMVKNIANIELDDGMTFEITEAYEIMEDSEYGGVRVEMKAHFGRSTIPMKLAISTGDALTPSAINYDYKLMLEDRSISILAYNTETVLAEKIETMLVRSTFNTRMRDFYDVWAISNMGSVIDYYLLGEAIIATIKTRGHDVNLADCVKITDILAESENMHANWENYRLKNDFASDLSWNEMLNSLRSVCEKIYTYSFTSQVN
jgi:predicted nucleotidyltransferase component of viral defense system